MGVLFVGKEKESLEFTSASHRQRNRIVCSTDPNS